MVAPVPTGPHLKENRTMTPMSRRDLLRTAGAGAALLALPSVTPAADPPAKGGFTLPPLPYAFDALEPHIDAKTMEIHHDRHHKAYVDNLNKALAGTEWAGKTVEEVLVNLAKLPDKVRGAARNNGGGHYNHTLFWQMMSPKGGKPAGGFTDAVANAFKDLDGMLKQLKEAAMTRFGSGWAWVVVQKGGKLAVVSSPNQDNTLMDATDSPGHGAPVLGIDVWEHAYYLKYQNKRADYIDAFFKVINWDFVSERYAALAKA
jgi:Fe-Mn family superoxide dismutase